MSIVKGSSGVLSVAASLITANSYSVAMWLKTPSVGSFGRYFDYQNTATNVVQIRDVNGPIRHRVEQEFNSSATTSGSITVDTWTMAIASISSDEIPRLATTFEALDAPGISGDFQTESSPTLDIFTNISDGTKAGMVAIYGDKLTTADETHLIAGGDPSDLPSATALVELWVDTLGVNTSGSDVTSWVGQISATTLTPTGTVTNDGADLAPYSYGSSGDTATVTESSLTDGGTISGTYTKADQWSGSDPDRGTVDNVPLTNFTAAAGVWSADNPDVYSIAEGLTYPTTAAVPDFGTVDVVVSDASYDAPAVSKVFNVKSGWAEVVLATVDTVTTEGLYLRINATVTPDRNIATTEKIYYDTVSGDVTVTDDGLYSLDGATNDFDFAVISATNNVDEAFQFSNLGGGGGNVPQTKFRRFPWQPYNPL